MTRMTVLIASADQQIVVQVREYLSSDRIELEHVSYGRGCISRLSTNNIKLLLLDERLSDINSEEIISTIRMMNPDLKIIFAIDSNGPEREIRLRREGVFYISPKPVNAKIIARVIEKAVDYETRKIFRVRERGAGV